jgi:hypothetical protein
MTTLTLLGIAHLLCFAALFEQAIRAPAIEFKD